MIYLVRVDHGGKVDAFAYKTEDYFLSNAAHVVGIEPKGATVEAIMRAGQARYATFELFASDWHAASAIKAGVLPPAASEALKALIDKRQHVAGRGFGLNGGI